MLRVGLVGCGFMGRMHATVYGLLPNAQLTTAWDKDPERLAQFCQEFGCQSAQGYEAMLAGGVDAVDVCLPTYLHRDATVAAAGAGKHVLCEKPMALTVAQAADMAAACKNAGVRLMIGHCIRYWPEYAQLKQVKDDGRYGGLLSVNLTRYGAFPSWSSDNWLADESKAGGGVLDMHIHDTDYAHYLLGAPDEVVSFGTVDKTGPAQAFTTMRFGQAVAHLEGGWNLPARTPFKMAFRAIFERGAAIFDGGPLTLYEEGKEPVVPEFPKMAAAGGGNISDLGGYFHEIKDFVDRLESGEPFTVVTPETSQQSLATCLAEIEAIKGRVSQRT
jgi:predicted dehydrogenase